MNKIVPRLILLVLMTLCLVSFGSSDIKVENLGDLNVDVAFQLALPYFLEQHFQYGEQLVFTYGPWGILLSPFTGTDYYLVALLFRMVFVVCVFLALNVLADRGNDQTSKIIIWGGAIGLVLLWITGHRDSYFLFPALLVFYQKFTSEIASDEGINVAKYRLENLFWIILSLLSGWAALVKFNIFIVASVAYLLILIVDVKRREWPVLPLVYITALLIAWLAAGQALVNLPQWILLSVDLSKGYVEAMAKGFFVPYNENIVLVFYFSVSMLMLASFSAAVLYRWSLAVFLSLVFTLFLSVVSVKHGMGGNQLEQAIALLAMVIWLVGQILLVSSSNMYEQSKRQWRYLGLSFLLTSAVGLAVVAGQVNFPILSPKNAYLSMSNNVSQLTEVLTGESVDERDSVLASFHRLWGGAEVASSERTIDVYPHQTGLVIGRKGLTYSPRPAFLSLNAHTFDLAMLNAQHLEGQAAPDLVLFKVQSSVNNRHPALGDGPSWPILLTNYEVKSVDDEFVLLGKRQKRLNLKRELLVEVDLILGEELKLPKNTGELMWVEMEISRSYMGYIVHLFFKSPHVLLESRLVDGKSEVFQVLPSLARAGFLLSPLMKNNEAFSSLYQLDGMRDGAVKSIKLVSPEAPRFFWKESMKLRIYALKVDTS